MKKIMIIWGMLAVFLLAAVAVSQAQDLEILEVKMRETEQSANYITVSWLVKVQNNTDTAKEVLVRVQFVDDDGFELESGNEWVVLRPGAITTVTDTVMIPADIYPQIKGIQASL